MRYLFLCTTATLIVIRFRIEATTQWNGYLEALENAWSSPIKNIAIKVDIIAVVAS